MSTSATPLSQRIQHILLERNGEPLALLEIQRLLRRQGFALDLSRLRVLLTSDLYTVLADDRYVLRDLLTPSAQPVASRSVFLIHLPFARTDYVVLDLETTGIHPGLDQIIQIAALRVVDGQPSALQSWYVACPPDLLSPSLRRALHLTDAEVQAIALAPVLDATWPDIRAFLGEQCLVIHNARFDMQFISRHDPTFTNHVVDALELAYLMAPEAPRHNLGDLATSLGIDLEALPAIPGMPSGYQTGVGSLHLSLIHI